MRYVVKVSDDALYPELLELVSKTHADRIRVVLPRRRLFAVDDLPESVVSALRKQGATVQQDYQYDQESIAGHAVSA